MPPLELVQMKFATSRKVTNVWEQSFFYLKLSSIGCKMFQKVYPEPFLANFQFFEEF